MSCKFMNVHQALSYLEGLCQSEDAEDGSGSSFFSANVCIQPPDDVQGESDKDSGDEEAPQFSNLGCRQLLAAATLEVHDETGRRVVGANNNNEVKEAVQIGSRKRRRMTGDSRISCAWRHKDMSHDNSGEWNVRPSALDTEKSPCALFEGFFTEEVYEFICVETIRYAHANGKHNFSVSVELKSFMAILLLSGYVVLPRRSMYWEHSEDTHNPVVSSLMSRNRFDSIMQNLHLADNMNLDQSDKFAKVRDIINHMNDSCLKNFLPQETISIDESMIPYFGRHGAKQYIHGKPIKFGYKMWVAATCQGYCIQFMPYLGAGSDGVPVLGLGGSVVDKLVSYLPDQDGSKYHLVMDNFFTSVKLLKHLKMKNVFATGTIRANRTEKAPLQDIKVMEKKPRGTHEVVVDVNSDLAVVRWKDNKVVTVASTYCGASPIGKAKRFSHADRRTIEISLPQVVRVYNMGMGGVDRLDQNLAVYMVNHRSKKWWWPRVSLLRRPCSK